jgi:ABC-2 type transport system ATP-binding protein
MDMGKVVLDDRVADDSGMDTLLDCHVDLRRADPAIAKALEGWGFAARNEGLSWHQVAGPDRLRFLGMVSRYVGLLTRIDMQEVTGVTLQ